MDKIFFKKLPKWMQKEIKNPNSSEPIKEIKSSNY